MPTGILASEFLALHQVAYVGLSEILEKTEKGRVSLKNPYKLYVSEIHESGGPVDEVIRAPTINALVDCHDKYVSMQDKVSELMVPLVFDAARSDESKLTLPQLLAYQTYEGLGLCLGRYLIPSLEGFATLVNSGRSR